MIRVNRIRPESVCASVGVQGQHVTNQAFTSVQLVPETPRSSLPSSFSVPNTGPPKLAASLILSSKLLTSSLSYRMTIFGGSSVAEPEIEQKKEKWGKDLNEEAISKGMNLGTTRHVGELTDTCQEDLYEEASWTKVVTQEVVQMPKPQHCMITRKKLMGLLRIVKKNHLTS